MSLPLEDYALIGDCQTAALVGRDGSIDWLCLPRFDSGAVFAELLGTEENGHWKLAPVGEIKATRRRYRPGTLVLETEFDVDGGTVRVTDCMPPRDELPDVLRLVECLRGSVRMRMDLVIRFDYGAIVPWVLRTDNGISAIAGPDMLRLRTDVPLHGEDFHTVAEFDLSEGQTASFDLTWYPSHEREPRQVDHSGTLRDAERWWREWSDRCSFGDGSCDDALDRAHWSEAVKRSLITLKALTYAPTGGIVAAPTTSLPEHLGGVRNWDYRYCWLRDATFTLYAMMNAGYHEEARAWREWLLRAVAGKPSQIQIMYGISGERRLTELQLPWLPGYEGSSPVRMGNAAFDQFQLDVPGEVMDALHQCRRVGLEPMGASWNLQKALMDFLETVWEQPDEGIWEVRGPRRHFTHSKVMAWVAFDRAVKGVEQFDRDGPADRWRGLRDRIRREIFERSYDPEVGAFMQSYGSPFLDASVLMMPLVGFLEPTDERMVGTVRAIEQRLKRDGFVDRYETDPSVDGLPPGEGSFLPCSFWLADNYALMGRRDDAVRMFESLLAIRNDVGLLSEEYDVSARRLVGNFPQAFTHIGLINTAYNLSAATTHPAEHRQHS
ncbi:glycoside hydrolase family 15 protein [Tautonia plasticadhaerens]|uniref:Trehalase n=1 Tax=Tautonia plasticadhaerens TaxID=2527974 RepID=A0A518GV29_9BACT|nr:glycoside hydrolase family 15 protein [Tautonia plasticadhaerens]QDV32444.1 Trehalase [Tautonia plasticadhaerens]